MRFHALFMICLKLNKTWFLLRKRRPDTRCRDALKSSDQFCPMEDLLTLLEDDAISRKGVLVKYSVSVGELTLIYCHPSLLNQAAGLAIGGG